MFRSEHDNHLRKTKLIPTVSAFLPKARQMLLMPIFSESAFDDVARYVASFQEFNDLDHLTAEELSELAELNSMCNEITHLLTPKIKPNQPHESTVRHPASYTKKTNSFALNKVFTTLELQYEILSYLDFPYDYNRLMRVSKSWKTVAYAYNKHNNSYFVMRHFHFDMMNYIVNLTYVKDGKLEKHSIESLTNQLKTTSERLIHTLELDAHESLRKWDIVSSAPDDIESLKISDTAKFLINIFRLALIIVLSCAAFALGIFLAVLYLKHVPSSTFLAAWTPIVILPLASIPFSCMLMGLVLYNRCFSHLATQIAMRSFKNIINYKSTEHDDNNIELNDIKIIRIDDSETTSQLQEPISHDETMERIATIANDSEISLDLPLRLTEYAHLTHFKPQHHLERNKFNLPSGDYVPGEKNEMEEEVYESANNDLEIDTDQSIGFAPRLMKFL